MTISDIHVGGRLVITIDGLQGDTGHLIASLIRDGATARVAHSTIRNGGRSTMLTFSSLASGEYELNVRHLVDWSDSAKTVECRSDVSIRPGDNRVRVHLGKCIATESAKPPAAANQFDSPMSSKREDAA